MDDRQFDDIIKKKIKEYREPGFDPVALADLHYRLTAVDAMWPWYVRYRTELFVGTGLLVCTLIILWSQWFLSGQGNALLNDNQRTLDRQGEQISKLQNEIAHLKHVQHDTVRVFEFRDRNSEIYASLLNRVSGLEATLENYVNKPEHAQVFSDVSSWDSKGNFAGAAYPHPMLYSNRLSPRLKEEKSVRLAWSDKDITIGSKEGAQLSVSAMRAIEKHYQKGIGIRVGPTLELSKGIYAVGNGKIDIAGGLLAEFILSPSLSLETGGKFAHRTYQILSQADLSSAQLPQLDESLGTPQGADIDSWILEVPINLKYRHPISLRRHWLVGMGLSPMLFTKQILEYNYELQGRSSASIYSTYRSAKPEFYSGTLNFSLGMSNEIKRKGIVETSIYYQYGWSAMGVENTKRSYLGVRGVYWFKIK